MIPPETPEAPEEEPRPGANPDAFMHDDDEANRIEDDVWESGEIVAEDDTVSAAQPQTEDGDEGETGSTSPDERDFEDLTLAEVTGLLLRRPAATIRAVTAVAVTPRWTPPPATLTELEQKRTNRGSAPIIDPGGGAEARVDAPSLPVPPADSPRAIEHSTRSRLIPANPPAGAMTQAIMDAPQQRLAARFGLYALAFAVSLAGNGILRGGEVRVEAVQLADGLPFLIAAFIIWLAAEITWNWPDIRRWWENRRQRGEAAKATELITEAEDSAGISEANAQAAVPDYYAGIRAAYGRGVLFVGAAVASVVTYLGTANNQFSFVGFWAWVIAIGLIVAATAPRNWSPGYGLRWTWDKLRALRDSFNWTLLALVLIMIVAGLFRFYDFTGTPPEMTSDHVEKLLDSQRVVDGARDVFFTNNGGREIFQMYAMALLTHLPGIEMNFEALKLLSVLEAMLTIPVLWWMGREVVGRYDPRLGNVVGLVLAALVAASYWHVALSRLALRIVLTPLVTALLVIYLGRGMRDNRRSDFIIAGLVLGFGLYMYQAVRMLPVVVIAGVAIAVLMQARRRIDWARYAVNFTTLVIVSFVVFVPLFRFSVDFPELFWMRTAGRLLGDDIIQEVDANGNVIERNATIGERLDAFNDNLPVLTSNIRNALLMYNWKGDVAWINGAPNEPAMSLFGGALLIVGLAAWAGFAARTRDPVAVLMPVMVVIMLLPSALSIAFPIENPSATRTSGSLPPVYLMAALPLALLAVLLVRVVNHRHAWTLGAGLVSLVVVFSFSGNANLYFNDYRESYMASSLPYTEPGRILHGFAQSDGSYGNAFMIAYPFWWDHRAVGMEAGILDWPNGIVSRDEVPDFLYDATVCRSGSYRVEPERDLLFFYHREDFETEALLQQWFPGGRILLHTTYQFNDDFKSYRILAPGALGLADFFDAHTRTRRC